MSTLLVDAGNSRLKWSLLSDNQPVSEGRGEQHFLAYEGSQPLAALTCLTTLLAQQMPQRLIIVQVLGDLFIENLTRLCHQQAIELQVVRSVAQAYGVSSAYSVPSHLGADRFVGLVAAYQQARQYHCPTILIDCGTAITLDTISVAGQHAGGMIMPGLNLMSSALVEKTQAAHMDHSTFAAPRLFAQNTAAAMGSGCVYAVVCAIEGVCARIEQAMGVETRRILCGGDAQLIYKELNQPAIFQLQPDALMDGLQVIAEQTACRS